MLTGKEVIVVGGGPSSLNLRTLLFNSGALVKTVDPLFGRPAGLVPARPKAMRSPYLEPQRYGDQRNAAAIAKRERRAARNRRLAQG